MSIIPSSAFSNYVYPSTRLSSLPLWPSDIKIRYEWLFNSVSLVCFNMGTRVLYPGSTRLTDMSTLASISMSTRESTLYNTPRNSHETVVGLLNIAGNG